MSGREAEAQWVDEVSDGERRFGVLASRILFDAPSPFQQVTIIDSPALGRALLLDRLWMTAEKDECTYHEMIVHPALVTAKQIKRVLVIGGGDGGTVREVLRHPEVEHVDMIEIDELVVTASREYLPTIGSAWNDPRLHVAFVDGAKFVEDAAPGSYDIVLIDGSDPVGPAVVLFEERFFKACARAVGPEGVVVTQGGSPTAQHEEHVGLIRTMSQVFSHVAPYYGPIGIYPGGAWSWVWATSGSARPDQPIAERVTRAEATSQYYNGQIQRGAFAVPNMVVRALEAK